MLRRLHILDVKRLMYVASVDPSAGLAYQQYQIVRLDADRLADHLRSGTAPPGIGRTESLTADRCVIVAIHDGRIVAYTWLAKDFVDAEDNFSRARHLGTSLHLPEGVGFVFNAWTAPDHRGRRLFAALLDHALRQRVLGLQSLLATIDWTNHASHHALKAAGLSTRGLIWRLGRGRMQLSILPSFDQPAGVRMAVAQPGWKWHWSPLA